MAKLESLGIKRLEGIHYYVHDLERSRQFYIGKLDFAETWRSVARARERRAASARRASQAGNIHVVCSAQPVGEGGRAARFLAQAPRRRRHADLRGRGHRAARSAARGARRHADRRHPDVHATTAARCASSRSPRRSATRTFRFRERDGYQRAVPGRGPARGRRRATSSASRRSITSRRTSRR